MTERLIDKMPCNRCANSFSCIKYCNEWIKWYKLCMKKLAEYEAAEEEGRLWIFPVAIGDKVYVINKYVNSEEWHLSNYEHIVTDILLNRNREPLFKLTNRYGTEKIKSFGKTVFLTREEAEKALKDRQEKPIALSSKIILDKQ